MIKKEKEIAKTLLNEGRQKAKIKRQEYLIKKLLKEAADNHVIIGCDCGCGGDWYEKRIKDLENA